MADEIVIDPKDFDISRVVVDSPTVITFKKGTGTITNVTSSGWYLNDEGRKCTLFFTAPRQESWGPSYKYPVGTTKENMTPEIAEGVQIGYPVTSEQTVSNPTDDEQAFINMLNQLRHFCYEKGCEETQKENCVLPGVTQNSFSNPTKKNGMQKAVKPITLPQKKDGQIDESKPHVMYANLSTTGKGLGMKVNTRIYGPGDKQLLPEQYLSKRGFIEPCFKWEGFRWGQHGDKTYGASVKFTLNEALFTPVRGTGASKLSKGRMIKKNTDPYVEEEFETPHKRDDRKENDSGEENDIFSSSKPTFIKQKEEISKPAIAKVAKTVTKPAVVSSIPVAKAKVTAPKKAAVPINKAIASVKAAAKANTEKEEIVDEYEEAEE